MADDIKKPSKQGWSKKYTIVIIIIAALTTLFTISAVTSGERSKKLDLAQKHCTVMEGADIYKEHSYSSDQNIFELGMTVCKNKRDNDYSNDTTYKEKFVSDIESKWSERKDESMDGHPLEWYLNRIEWKF